MAQTIITQSTAVTPIPPPSYPAPRSVWERVLPILVAFALIGAWYLSTREAGGLAFVIATPEATFAEFVKLINNGSLFRNLGVTLGEVLIGWAGGAAAALTLGYGIATNRLLERLLGPYAVALQAVPIIAIAPILITRLGGPGPASVAIIAGLIVFFPMLMTVIVGFRGIDPTLREMMLALHANRRQMFWLLEVPAAAPALFGGLKVSATLSVIGAVVGEAYGASAGVGYVIYSARFMYNPAGVMVGVFTLTALALTLYEIVARLERRALRWRR